jgi:RND family efflux transporter MFP subunit
MGDRRARIERAGLIAIGGLSLMLGLGACAAEDTPSTEEGTPAGSEAAPARAPRGRQVRVETVATERFVERVDINATVLSDTDVTLSARTSGTLDWIAALGATVTDGAKVAQLDPGLARAALAEATATLQVAETQLALAQHRFDRQQPLAEQQVISPLEFEDIQATLAQSKAQVAQAKAGVGQAREQLDLTRLVAPFGGFVEARFVEQGEQVAAGTPVLRVVDSRRVKIRGAVPERYARDIAIGTRALVRFVGYGIEPVEGKVDFVGRAIDPDSRTFTVEVRLPNPDQALKPEMVARMLLDRSVMDPALSVPLTAVLSDDEGQSVFVVEDRDGTSVAARRRVDVGPRSEGRIVIEAGLASGDVVVVVGQNGLASGDLVEVVSEAGS